MGKIIATSEIESIVKRLKDENKTTVLAGGCFDLLHVGHIKFIRNAKAQGDVLMLLLEHDASVANLKGLHRPIHKQQDRAEVLAALCDVDYIVLLPAKMNDNDYERLIIQIKPAIIATTKRDPAKHHKVRHARIINAGVVDVIDRISDQSSSKLAEIVAREFGV